MEIIGYTSVSDYQDMILNGTRLFIFDGNYKNNGFRNLLTAVIYCQYDIKIIINGGSYMESENIKSELEKYVKYLSIQPHMYNEYIEMGIMETHTGY